MYVTFVEAQRFSRYAVVHRRVLDDFSQAPRPIARVMPAQ
jgi:hypothetical protein